MPERRQVTPAPSHPQDQGIPAKPSSDGGAKSDDQGVPLAASALVIAVVLLVVSTMA